MTHAVRLHACPPVDASIRPPGSKSITNRALICAALAEGPSCLRGVLDSEDTEVMIGAWQQLGLKLRHDRSAATVEIDGCGGVLPISAADLYVANSGTTIRFLTAALAACHGEFKLSGVPRMHERPIADLLDALRQLGANVESVNLDNPGCPPVHLQAQGLAGGSATVAGNISSQFLSGLMMAAPLARQDVNLLVEGALVSVPYVEMTAEVMRAFGASIRGPVSGPFSIDVNHRYVGTDYSIEPDASAASYFWGAAAITGGRARVEGLSQSSLQGDVRFCEVLEQMGCHVKYERDAIEVTAAGPLRGVSVNMADISDTVQTLAAVALFAEGATSVRGVAHNRVKETDRISDLARELEKLGAEVEEFHDGLRMIPPTKLKPAQIETYRDHRMAMSMALVGLQCSGIEILDPDCTAKTYPEFWRDLELFSGCRVERLG
mgnify:CR=1 FL=1